ncbi:hypothetical protein T492DRAFT_836789 [Pavlovales sp. CCMP2436]|nr:hypothetical protein T492DRAFT_836789 [Pavlovales sp. CCMP2436]
MDGLLGPQLAALWPQLAGVALYYTACKLGVRLLFGCAEDERGWGKPETSICAFVHQIVTAFLGYMAMARCGSYADLEDWLLTGWRLGTRLRTEELLIMVANLAEMLTDTLLYSRYRGYGTSYHLHHLTTLLATLCFIARDSAPVGMAVLFSSILETGSCCLNAAGLFPCGLTYTIRLVCYPLSRLLATALLCQCTLYGWRGHVGVPLISFAPVWVLMLLNIRWATQILVGGLRRQGTDPWEVRPAQTKRS